MKITVCRYSTPCFYGELLRLKKEKPKSLLKCINMMKLYVFKITVLGVENLTSIDSLYLTVICKKRMSRKFTFPDINDY